MCQRVSVEQMTMLAVLQAQAVKRHGSFRDKTKFEKARQRVGNTEWMSWRQEYQHYFKLMGYMVECLQMVLVTTTRMGRLRLKLVMMQMMVFQVVSTSVF